MLKLYYATETCSMASRIILEELGLPHSLVEVSFRKNLNVDELKKVNPLGRVPALITAEGKTLTQNVAIQEYLADQKPAANLIGPPGSWERRETISWLAFVTSDLQRSFDPLFQLNDITASEPARADIKKFAIEALREFLTHIDQKLAGKDYVTGKQFTAADAYLYTILGWTKWLEIPTDSYPHLTAFVRRVYARPAVQAVLKSEDLLDYLGSEL